MKIAYLDCFSGISGDMTLSALVDAGASLDRMQSAIDSLGLPQVRLKITEVHKNGFRASHLRIEHPPEHAHRHLSEIISMIKRGTMSDRAREIAIAIFQRIAEAEARVHGMSINQVHFHEVGAIDSIADIVGVAVGWDQLGIRHAVASPVPVGAGQIEIAHGLVSVPAPATTELLKGIPIAPCAIEAELTTPTGAAILAELVSEYGPLPAIHIRRIGYGAGTRELHQRPNLLRLILGDSIELSIDSQDSIVVMETNLDDISGEQIGFAIERLWNAGALDVFCTPIQMKKNRPGTLLTILARVEDQKNLESIVFEETRTLGIRFRVQHRSTLKRQGIDVVTPWGIVRGKLAEQSGGRREFSPEFDDCRQIAIEHSIPFVEVIRQVIECYHDRNLMGGQPGRRPSPPPPPPPRHDHGPISDHGHDHSHDHDHGPGHHHDHG